MESKLNSICQQCGEAIHVGDEIVRVSNGIWTHNGCSLNSDIKLTKNNSEMEKLNENLLESKINRNKSLKCSNCGGTSFLKPNYETSILDSGGALTKKLFICHNCSYIMQFVEKII
jgi:DNA-directed RNA polymerase subunit RPC12/RpoP